MKQYRGMYFSPTWGGNRFELVGMETDEKRPAEDPPLVRIEFCNEFARLDDAKKIESAEAAIRALLACFGEWTEAPQ